MRRRLSLRARLILGVIALAAVGLVAADFATYSELRSFLVTRTDGSLDAAHIAVEGALFHQHSGGPGDESSETPSADGTPDLAPLIAAAPGEYVELRKLDGTVVRGGSAPRFPGGQTAPPPLLPAHNVLPAAAGQGERVVYFTARSKDGDDRYRVRASIEPQAKNYVLIVAQPLTDVDSTLHRLLLIALLVTGLVLVCIAVLGLWVVRLGLRPLEAIAATASEIAAGDLSRRVEREDSRTEVGRLGRALNGMLGQIEAAATARETSLRALEASERKLRRFVADASHELRTPLAAVRAYAELFTRGAAERPDDLKRSMSGISRESERMSVLVDDLLLLARLDEGRPLVLEPVQLGEVVAEAVETAHMVDPERMVEVDADPVVVLGDRERLRQAVDNLLSNVRSHTPAGAPARVRLHEADGMARLEVADSGPGMDPEQCEHVFERFYRADPSRSRASGGAGLGLSIVAAVVEAHGGQVSASSVPGEGATFRIELPLVQA
ncbi:MAG: two-component system, OmpR family, sensor kinase [Gaiellaceae bacterium]|nr:two-component system, OmpR family, sensor kinase [Gaiellaceae bacterium]